MLEDEVGLTGSYNLFSKMLIEITHVSINDKVVDFKVTKYNWKINKILKYNYLFSFKAISNKL